MSVHHYEIDVRPLSAELGGGFIAIAPELPGCMADGDTPEKALKNGYDAAACWIAEAERMGREVPEPRRVYA